jgi:hypothetical protein
MKYNLYFVFVLFFCLDDADTKNKNMDANTKKTKITEGYDLVSEPSSDTNWCEPHDHATHNQD